MKKLLMILAVVLMASPAAAQLIITGAMDATLSYGVPKVVELYACDDIADLSIYGLGCANNGGGSDGVEFTFPADFIPAGTFIYCEDVNNSNPTAFFDFMGFNSTYDVGQAAGTNGDDAIELFLVSGTTPVVVDVFGDINTDGTGQPWEYLDGWAKRISGSGPDGDVFDINAWTFSGPNAMDGESTNASAATPFVVGNFTCDPAVADEAQSFGSVKSLFR